MSGGNAYELVNRRRAQANPWDDLVAWLRRLRKIDAEWQMPAVVEMIERDDRDVMELTSLSRRQ